MSRLKTVAVVLAAGLLVAGQAVADLPEALATVTGSDPAGDAAPESDWAFKLSADEMARADITGVRTVSTGETLAVTVATAGLADGEAALTVNFDTNGDYKVDYGLARLGKRAELYRFSPGGKVDTGFITVTATGVGTNEMTFRVPLSEFKGDIKSFGVQAKAALNRGRGTDWAPGSTADAKGWYTAGGAPAPVATPAPAAETPKPEPTAAPSPTTAPTPAYREPARAAPVATPAPPTPGFEAALALAALVTLALLWRRRD